MDNYIRRIKQHTIQAYVKAFQDMMKRQIPLALIILTCSSCATLFNSKTKQLSIITDTPATVIMNKDTLKSSNNQTHIDVLRQQAPILLKVFNDSISKNITIHSKNSFAYWSNLGFLYGLGALIEMNKPKRYTYPATVYLSMKNNSTNYYTIDTAAIKNKFCIVKLSPLKLVDFANSGIELSCEKRTGNYFATQVMVSYLLPISIWNLNYGLKPDIKGFRLAIEEKYYFRKSAPIGPYTSLELNYLKSNYIDSYSNATYNNSNYPDSLRINKQTFSINLKVGYQHFIKRFAFDFYVGLGLRYKDVRFLDNLPQKRYFNFNHITSQKGQYWTAIVPMSIRVGWTF
jgi:hypothetical protein